MLSSNASPVARTFCKVLKHCVVFCQFRRGKQAVSIFHLILCFFHLYPYYYEPRSTMDWLLLCNVPHAFMPLAFKFEKYQTKKECHNGHTCSFSLKAALALYNKTSCHFGIFCYKFYVCILCTVVAQNERSGCVGGNCMLI